MRRIQTKRDFLEREIVHTAIAYEQGKTSNEVLPEKPPFTPTGWCVEQLRRFRGVDARPLAPADCRTED
jgi:hypothetical protein